MWVLLLGNEDGELYIATMSDKPTANEIRLYEDSYSDNYGTKILAVDLYLVENIV